ncbi:hypothetical protein HK099_002825, partial [Clydaea vesicula]
NDIKESIKNDKFPEFCQNFMYKFYKERISKVEGGNRFGGQGLLEREPEVVNDPSDIKNEKTKVKLLQDPGKDFNEKGFPIWIDNALSSVGIYLQ